MALIDLGWPLRGDGVLGGAGVLLYLLLILAAVPAVWALLRWRVGVATAGPLWLLLVFEVMACVYALLTPPWQAPDEPHHMLHVELARHVSVLVNEQAGLARPTTREGRAYRQSTDEILHSMLATDTAHWLPFPKPLRDYTVIPFASELSHPPVYYALASVVTRPVAGAPLLARLASVRALGVVLEAWVVWACGAVARLVWGARSRRAEVPMALAVAVPGFCALAGSASNDRLADLIAALLIALLVAGVLERTALSRPIPWVVGVVGLCILGALTKRTLLPLFVLVPAAVGVRLRHRVRLLFAAGVVVAVAGGVVLALSSPRLALWEREPSPAASARCRDPHGGQWAICLAPYANVKQQLPLVRARGLAGDDLDLGFWVRAPGAPGKVRAVVQTTHDVVIDQTAQASGEWAYVTARGHAPRPVDELSLTIDNPSGASVHVDDVALRRGTHDNRIVNGSGEAADRAVPRFLPTAVQRGANSAIEAISRVVRDPGAITASAGLVASRAADAFAMYWGTAGWRRPAPVPPTGLVIALGLLVAVGVAGSVAALVRRRFPAGGLLLLAACVVALAALAKELPPDAAEQLYGRYLYPGLAAQTAVLAAGIGYFWRWGEASLRQASRASIAGFHALFLTTVFVPFLLK